MKRFTVNTPPVVENLITEQVLYIAEDSIDNALAWEGRLRIAIKAIGDLAQGHAVDQEASDRIGFSVRKMVFERTYLVYYRIDEAAGVVRVINFRHGARLPRAGEA